MQDPQKQLQLELFLTRPGLRARAVLGRKDWTRRTEALCTQPYVKIHLETVTREPPLLRVAITSARLSSCRENRSKREARAFPPHWRGALPERSGREHPAPLGGDMGLGF